MTKSKGTGVIRNDQTVFFISFGVCFAQKSWTIQENFPSERGPAGPLSPPLTETTTRLYKSISGLMDTIKCCI
jgi:hypothetical protein